MTGPRAPQPHLFCLPPGTPVEDWRVVGCQCHGAYGVVYRALRAGQEAAGLVALKVALFPWDPRFMREVALLSLIRHPSVPRLLGHGFRKDAWGTVFPFIVMEWIEGLPLYDWAHEHHPSNRQMAQVLAHLARALQATHAASAMHRDVKGGNVLVRRSDGRAMLTDFGAGNYQDAARLTWQPLPPGTPAYQSPEARLFAVRSARSPEALYVARPSDDVYALGVTAYRLVTGEYPPLVDPRKVEGGTRHRREARVSPPWELNPRVERRLGALILRMLSWSPQARGTAGELAEALEAVAEHECFPAEIPAAPARAEAAAPRAEEFREEPRAPLRRSPRRGAPPWMRWSALALATVALLVCMGRALRMRSEALPVKRQVASEVRRPGAGTTALGDTAQTSPLASEHVPASQEPIAEEPLPEPFPGQLRPDARGQCPNRGQVPINGGCWVEQRSMEAEACAQNGYVFFKGSCYTPSLAPRRKPQPTSDPLAPQ